MHFAKYLALCPSKRSGNLHSKFPRVSRKYAAKTKVNGQKAEKILKENLQNRPKSPHLTVFTLRYSTAICHPADAYIMQ